MEPELKETGNYSHILRFFVVAFTCYASTGLRHFSSTAHLQLCSLGTEKPSCNISLLEHVDSEQQGHQCTRGREHQDEYVQSTEGTAECLSIQKAFDFNPLEKFGKVEYQPSETSFMHNRTVQTQTSAAEGWGLSPARVRQKAGEGHGAEAAAPRRALPTSRQRGAVFSSELLPGHLFTEIMLLFWERLFLCLPNKWK